MHICATLPNVDLNYVSHFFLIYINVNTGVFNLHVLMAWCRVIIIMKDGRQAQCISQISTPSKIAFSLTDDSSVQGTFSMRVLPGKKQGRKKKIISTKGR